MHATTNPTLAKPGAPRVAAAAVALAAAVAVAAVIGSNVYAPRTAPAAAAPTAPLNVDPPEAAIKAALAAPLIGDLGSNRRGYTPLNAAEDRTPFGPGDVQYQLGTQGYWVPNGSGGIEFVPTGPSAHDIMRGYLGWWAFDPALVGDGRTYSSSIQDKVSGATAAEQSTASFLQEEGKRRFGTMHRTLPHDSSIEGNDLARGISIR
jgi:hypothetical protein